MKIPTSRGNLYPLLLVAFLISQSYTGQIYSQDIVKIAEKCKEGNEKSCDRLYKLAQEHPKSQVRLEAISHIENLQLLEKIVSSEKDQDLRLAAISNIFDQGILENIIREDPYIEHRLAAIENLTNQRTLAQIVLRNEMPEVRMAAFEKVENTDFIHTIAIKSLDSNILYAALKKITDQKILGLMAQTERISQIRHAAFMKITDQAVFADIALNGIYEDTRKISAMRITDKNALGEIAKRVENEATRRVAFYSVVKDPDILLDIVYNGEYIDVRRAALRLQKGSDILLEIAKTCEEKELRQIALNKLNDQADLIDLALNASFEDIRIESLNHISDLEVLALIAKTVQSPGVALAAVYRIPDEDILYDIISNLNDPRLHVRPYYDGKNKYDYNLNFVEVYFEALQRITSRDMLDKVFQTYIYRRWNSSSKTCIECFRKEQINRTDNQYLLSKIVEYGQKDAHSNLDAYYALLNITDQTILRKYIWGNYHETIKILAELRLLEKDPILTRNLGQIHFNIHIESHTEFYGTVLDGASIYTYGFAIDLESDKLKTHFSYDAPELAEEESFKSYEMVTQKVVHDRAVYGKIDTNEVFAGIIGSLNKEDLSGLLRQTEYPLLKKAINQSRSN